MSRILGKNRYRQDMEPDVQGHNAHYFLLNLIASHYGYLVVSVVIFA